ncbi:mitochondrial fission 1 protein [Neolentinus lepideus HHB14362 ss-1]|uniref:Mitochondrial fission 1 protein n=1 Tax=Neolentinus lepideus HHB14362 ss-1 TaxID=1314782 RepID=A0A165UAG2_9AGAM|nr:mitochondrial fission 1 protein [Neolentinus lepideus HHB14362 ss-1]
MPTELPYAADAEVSLSFDELDVLRLQYEKEVEAGHITVQTKFNYAWGLVKSPVREDQVEGVRLLQGTHNIRILAIRKDQKPLMAEIYRAEPARRRECLYYLALGHYKMGNYEDSKKFNGLLLEKEPTNLQAHSLQTLVDKRLARDGYIGMALAGGAAAIGTVLLAGLIRRATRK